MKKFRASYSVLSLWEAGRYEEAVAAYFKLPGLVTPQMEAGKEYHKKWEEHITKTKTLPEELGGDKLIKPQAEIKIEMPIYDWLELVCVIDCLDSPVMYEFKTGVKDSSSHGKTFQAGIYGLLCRLKKLPVDRCHIIHYNQYTKKKDISIFWLTDQLLLDALNWVESNASEMAHYLETNNIEAILGKEQNDNKKTQGRD